MSPIGSTQSNPIEPFKNLKESYDNPMKSMGLVNQIHWNLMNIAWGPWDSNGIHEVQPIRSNQIQMEYNENYIESYCILRGPIHVHLLLEFIKGVKSRNSFQSHSDLQGCGINNHWSVSLWCRIDSISDIIATVVTTTQSELLDNPHLQVPFWHIQAKGLPIWCMVLPKRKGPHFELDIGCIHHKPKRRSKVDHLQGDT